MNGEQSFFEQQQKMLAIAREMKEIPELPSEAPKDIKPLQRVEFPKEGGIQTYMQDIEYPYAGYPFYEFVDKVDIFKKVARAFLSGMYHSLKSQWKIRFLTLIPSIWVAKCLVRAGIYVFYKNIERFRIKPIKYCKAVRELYRSFTENTSGELSYQLRDVLCMVLEFDNAYRFRFQDIITELYQNNDIVKELDKMFMIMQSRERTQFIHDTWTLFRLTVKYYLKYDKELKLIIDNVLKNINIDEVKFTKADKYYCLRRQDYNFGFITTPNEEDSEFIAYEKLVDKQNEEMQVLKDLYYAELKELTEKQNKEFLEITPKLSDEEKQAMDSKVQLEFKKLDEQTSKLKDEIIQTYAMTSQQVELSKKQILERKQLTEWHEILQASLVKKQQNVSNPVLSG